VQTRCVLYVILELKHGPKERKCDRTILVASTIRLLNVEVHIHNQGSTFAIYCR